MKEEDIVVRTSRILKVPLEGILGVFRCVDGKKNTPAFVGSRTTTNAHWLSITKLGFAAAVTATISGGWFFTGSFSTNKFYAISLLVVQLCDADWIDGCVDLIG